MWKEENNQLTKQFDFPDFQAALVFVNRIGKLTEEVNHHPDIQLGYGSVTVRLTTHDKGGVTDKDRTMAEAIDRL